MQTTCCGPKPPRLATKAADPTALPPWFERLLDDMYNDRIPPEALPLDLYDFTASILTAAMAEGMDIGFDAIDPATELAKFTNRIRANLYSFSAAKSYSQMLEMRDAVFDGQGAVRPFTEFRDDALQVNSRYNENWLAAERQAVVGGTLSGREWLDIQQDKEAFPYLEYVAVADDRTRRSHMRLHATVLPVDDPFWNQYYPPNGWNCRCTTRQISEAPNGGLSDSNEAVSRGDMAAETYFRKNTGQTDIFEADKTAYYEAVPDDGNLRNGKQLQAVKHYRLRTYNKIMERTDQLPIQPSAITSEAQARTYWNDRADNQGNMTLRNARIGQPVQAAPALRDMLINGQRYDELEALPGVVRNPDEVWQGLTGRDALQTTYIKYFTNKPYVVAVRPDATIASVDRLDDTDKLEGLRRGVLLSRK